MSNSDEMASLLKGLARLTRAIQAQTKALNALAASNAEMADAVFSTMEQEGETDAAKVDMAGNPIRPS